MNTDEKEKMELETGRLLRALLERWQWILLGGLLGAVAVLLVTVLFVKPAYQSDVLFCVTNRTQAEENMTPEDISASRDLVGSCAVIVSSRAFLKETASLAGVDRTWKELQRMMAAASVEGTEFLRVTVTSTSPEEAARVAEAVGTLLPDRVPDILNGAGAELIDEAVFSAQACGPNYVSNGVIGCLLGLLLSCGGVVVMTWVQKYREEK